MSAVLPTSPSLVVIKELSVLGGSSETGEIAYSSSNVLSTQILEKRTAEVRSFTTRSLDAVVEMMTRIWSYIKALFSRATPEEALAVYVIAIRKTNLTTREILVAFHELLFFSNNLLKQCSKKEAVAIQAQIQTSCDELPLKVKKKLYHCLELDMGEFLTVCSQKSLDYILEGLWVVYDDLPPSVE